ncbi:hypothetical protein [Methanobacterium spitsbergense]|uniref:Uncharacterized protein n=1 Tax=Methanobacterium spitsbergense TaxID=2874285 RepID=A0A8T5V192_9EURY|nr:hypothetical protein [Methanobacterium spitsbergense]MBZ2166803.1 hypothetical protein [Methanobacterium spitsbergense]
MDITNSFLNTTSSLILLIITFTTFYFPLRIYLNLLKYKEASLGLIFTNLDSNINVFKIYAIAVLIFAISRFLDLFNLISNYSSIDNLATLLNIITNVLLIYAFYKLLVIIQIDESMNKELNKP